MIEVFGEFVMPIAELSLDDIDAFKLRLEKANVQELAKSVEQVGLLHLPMVRRSDGRFIFGEDRLAAHCLLERDDILCRLVECSDEELLLLREAENKHRRNDTAAELLARVEAAEAALAEELRLQDAAMCFVSPRGRPKKQRTEAIERVAASAGRSAEAVRKATEREAKKRDLAVIETWGREQPETWLEPVLEARASFTDAAGKVQAAMAALTRLGTASQLREGVLSAQHGSLKLAAQQLRLSRPAAVCAWCKNLVGVVHECKACRGLGYLTEEELGQVPEKLKDPKMVMRNGGLTLAPNLETNKAPVVPFRVPYIGGDGTPLVSTPHSTAEASAEFARRAEAGEPVFDCCTDDPPGADDSDLAPGAGDIDDLEGLFE